MVEKEKGIIEKLYYLLGEREKSIRGERRRNYVGWHIDKELGIDYYGGKLYEIGLLYGFISDAKILDSKSSIISFLKDCLRIEIGETETLQKEPSSYPFNTQLAYMDNYKGRIDEASYWLYFELPKLEKTLT